MTYEDKIKFMEWVRGLTYRGQHEEAQKEDEEFVDVIIEDLHRLERLERLRLYDKNT